MKDGRIGRWLESYDPAAWASVRKAMRPAPHSPATDAVGRRIEHGALPSILDAVPTTLLPDAVLACVPARRRRYIAGRLCAECALEAAGRVGAVGRGPQGEPLWPKGSTGSITHTGTTSCAVVLRWAAGRTLGIDSQELATACECRAIETLCLTEREAQALPMRDGRAAMATLLFSAKEAGFKAFYPIHQRFIDFTAYEAVNVNQVAHEIRLAPTDRRAATPSGAILACRFLWIDKTVHCWVLNGLNVELVKASDSQNGQYAMLHGNPGAGAIQVQE
jgi:enterobactin synthetase component D